MVEYKSYPKLPFCQKEILRYAGCKTAENTVLTLLNSCIQEVQDQLRYQICYRELPLSLREDLCDFNLFCVQSQKLASHLKDCSSVILMAATIGIGIDRLITRYSRLAPSRALMFQAIGAAQIETLCDTFCKELEQKTGKQTMSRFSPGYADLSLQTQTDVFAVLNCEKKIGLTLNSSMLMSPSKSVTAFVGLTDSACAITHHSCESCNQKDCLFKRGAL